MVVKDQVVRLSSGAVELLKEVDQDLDVAVRKLVQYKTSGVLSQLDKDWIIEQLRFYRGGR